MFAIVTCRKCKSPKAKKDICPVCASGAAVSTLKVHKGQPTAVKGHFFHALTVVPVHTAKGY